MQIIKFNAVWCPGCLVMRPVWKKVLEAFPNLKITEYDYDADEDEVLKYQVGDKLPVTIMLDDDGKEVKRLVGEKSMEELIRFIEG